MIPTTTKTHPLELKRLSFDRLSVDVLEIDGELYLRPQSGADVGVSGRPKHAARVACRRKAALESVRTIRTECGARGLPLTE